LIGHVTVVPAQAGTHNHRLWNMGPRFRGDDGKVRYARSFALHRVRDTGR